MKDTSTTMTIKKVLRVVSLACSIIGAVSSFLLMYMYLGDVTDYLKKTKVKISDRMEEHRQKKLKKSEEQK